MDKYCIYKAVHRYAFFELLPTLAREDSYRIGCYWHLIASEDSSY